MTPLFLPYHLCHLVHVFPYQIFEPYLVEPIAFRQALDQSLNPSVLMVLILHPMMILNSGLLKVY